MSERGKIVAGLRLFVAAPPFEGMAYAVLDREGPWTQRMLDGDPDDFIEPPNPPRAGLLVWEGARHDRGPDEVGWVLRGTWRRPSPVEMSRLAAGKFPLRGHALPTLDALEDFEPRSSKGART